ncbi:MAG: helix-turn-helix transcriptional regulator [Candidatus Sungbacteria bacterium]|nr:helix-turn-helix transcriptional regulator [Candidatus Sungbacteria bacterium]
MLYFDELLKQKKEENGWTENDLANFLGVQQGVLNPYIRGRIKGKRGGKAIGLKIIDIAAEKFNIPREEIEVRYLGNKPPSRKSFAVCGGIEDLLNIIDELPYRKAKALFQKLRELYPEEFGGGEKK